VLLLTFSSFGDTYNIKRKIILSLNQKNIVKDTLFDQGTFSFSDIGTQKNVMKQSWKEKGSGCYLIMFNPSAFVSFHGPLCSIYNNNILPINLFPSSFETLEETASCPSDILFVGLCYLV